MKWTRKRKHLPSEGYEATFSKAGNNEVVNTMTCPECKAKMILIKYPSWSPKPEWLCPECGYSEPDLLGVKGRETNIPDIGGISDICSNGSEITGVKDDKERP